MNLWDLWHSLVSWRKLLSRLDKNDQEPSMSRYVLFREDPNTHKEVYLSGVPLEGYTTTSDPSLAIPFTRARTGYEFGERHELHWWRVGQR